PQQSTRIILITTLSSYSMSAKINLTDQEKKEVFRSINEKSDRIMAYALVIYFLLGVGVAFVYNTFFIALCVGALSLMAYFTTKALLPNRTVHHYVLSVVFVVFTAQFIYQ